MNRELVHIMRGILLAIVLFAGIKLLRYSINKPFIINPKPNYGFIDSNGASERDYSKEAINGKMLFANNCASCHAINKKLTGPALAGVTLRITDEKLLMEWIRNSAKVLKKGNPYFNNLYKEYQIKMNEFPSLTDNEIRSILRYISEQAML